MIDSSTLEFLKEQRDVFSNFHSVLSDIVESDGLKKFEGKKVGKRLNDFLNTFTNSDVYNITVEAYDCKLNTLHFNMRHTQPLVEGLRNSLTLEIYSNCNDTISLDNRLNYSNLIVELDKLKKYCFDAVTHLNNDIENFEVLKREYEEISKQVTEFKNNHSIYLIKDIQF